MQKGKFGFSLWLYPYLSLWGLYLNMDLVPFLIAGFVIKVEQDEWTSKQCLHTIMICCFYNMYRLIADAAIDIPLIGAAFLVVDMIIMIIFLILVFVMGFHKLKNGQSITMFGMGIINRAYGYIPQQYTQPQQPQYAQQPPQQPYAQPPYQQQQYAQPQPYAQPQQPQYAPPQAAPAAPPNDPPPAAPGGFTPPPPPPA